MSNGEILVSLDIGTSEVKIIIGEVLQNSLNIIGVGTADSIGMKKGAIVDIDRTIQSIREAVNQAERMIGMEIKRVVVGINGNHIQLQPCHGVVAVQSENREITNADVQRVIEGAQVVSIPPEREIIDCIPRQFIVDGLEEINDPRGMIGVRLEMEGTIITCSKTVLHNILKCVEGANLEILDIVLQPLAAGSIALSRDERNLGVALIDIGGGSTTVSVFENNELVATSVIPLGGDNITKDVSIGLRTSTEEAEKIKLQYGQALYDLAHQDETFSVTLIGSEQQKIYSQVDIADIIEARLEEIYTFVIRELQAMGYYDLPGGYVLTGGTMKMPGVYELAEKVFQANVRIAIPDFIGVREPQYTAGIGILKFGYENAKIQGKQFSQAVNIHTSEQPIEYVQNQSKQARKPRQKKESRIANLFNRFFD